MTLQPRLILNPTSGGRRWWERLVACRLRKCEHRNRLSPADKPSSRGGGLRQGLTSSGQTSTSMVWDVSVLGYHSSTRSERCALQTSVPRGSRVRTGFRQVSATAAAVDYRNTTNQGAAPDCFCFAARNSADGMPEVMLHLAGIIARYNAVTVAAAAESRERSRSISPAACQGGEPVQRRCRVSKQKKKAEAEHPPPTAADSAISHASTFAAKELTRWRPRVVLSLQARCMHVRVSGVQLGSSFQGPIPQNNALRQIPLGELM